MNLFHALLNLLHWISLFLSAAIYGKQKQIEDADIAQNPDPETIFYTQSLERFLDTYRKYSASEMNSNVEPVFYDKEQYKAAVELPDNELELAWRKRHVNLSTPRGNVIMFYDAYKLGFAYYSDQYIPYKMLNAVAMKYVVMFRCRDFFVDETIVPDNHKSGLINVRLNAPTDNNNNKTKAYPGFVMPDDAPFAKLKSAQEKTKVQKKETTENKIINKFIKLGGVRDYTPLQKTKKVNPLNGFQSDAMPKSIMTYKQYKQKGLSIM